MTPNDIILGHKYSILVYADAVFDYAVNYSVYFKEGIDKAIKDIDTESLKDYWAMLKSCEETIDKELKNRKRNDTTR